MAFVGPYVGVSETAKNRSGVKSPPKGPQVRRMLSKVHANWTDPIAFSTDAGLERLGICADKGVEGTPSDPRTARSLYLARGSGIELGRIRVTNVT
jgi:hypothetical protein